MADQEDDDTYTCFSEEQFNPADRGLSDEQSSKLVCADDDASPGKEGRQVPGGGGIVPFAQRNDSEPCDEQQTAGLPEHKIDVQKKTNENESEIRNDDNTSNSSVCEEEETKSSDRQLNSDAPADLDEGEEGEEGGRRVQRDVVEDSTFFCSASQVCDGADQEETKSSSDARIEADTHKDVTECMISTKSGSEQEKDISGDGGDDEVSSSQQDSKGAITNLVSARLELVESELLRLAGTEEPGTLRNYKGKGLLSNEQKNEKRDHSHTLVPKTQRGPQRTKNPGPKQCKPKVVKKEPDFVPSCAYAQKGSRRQTKEVVEATQTKTKPLRYSRKRLEELSRPFKHFGSEKETADSNCQKKARPKKCPSSDDRGFLERMEWMEKVRSRRRTILYPASVLICRQFCLSIS